MNRGSTVFFFSKVVLMILFVFTARPRTNLLISCELQWETVQKGLRNVTYCSLALLWKFIMVVIGNK